MSTCLHVYMNMYNSYIVHVLIYLISNKSGPQSAWPRPLTPPPFSPITAVAPLLVIPGYPLTANLIVIIATLVLVPQFGLPRVLIHVFLTLRFTATTALFCSF